MENYLFNAAENYFYSKSPDPFSYKDAGDTEKNLFDIISKSIDRSVFSQELMSRAHDWPTYYHLTSLRSNILRPFEKKIKNGSTLELGAGCGAVTRFIGELGGKVTAVEGSMARARVIGARCVDLPNVEVVADLIQNFKTTEKFDVVTLIGVLEYSRLYIKTGDPVQTLLELARTYLKPDGIVVLAIENQIGLKYFCGAPEDHFGCPMFGVNNSYTENSIVTFGRKELSDRCKNAGFASIKLYVPVPDYKTPVSIIYPEGFLENQNQMGWDIAPILSGAVFVDRQNPVHPTFSLEAALTLTANNGLGQDLANSFLFELGNQPNDLNKNVLAAHYGTQRPAKHSKETRFTINANGVIANTRYVSDTRNLDSVPWAPSVYYAGAHWHSELIRLVNRPVWSMKDLAEWASVWINALKKHATLGAENTIPELAHYKRLLPDNFIDATPANFIVKNSHEDFFFDLEWNLSKAIPLEFVVFRGLFMSFIRITSCARPGQDVPLKLVELIQGIMQINGLEILKNDWELFLLIFNSFQNQTQNISGDVLNEHTSQIATEFLKVRQLFT